MIRSQIYFPKTQHDQLRGLASRKRTTISRLVRLFVSQGMSGQKQPIRKSGAQSLFELLEKVKKLGQYGPKDLASNIDEYLYGQKRID
jgi:hypothetical protein